MAAAAALVGTGLYIAMACTASAAPIILYQQSFDTDTPDTPATLSTYPEFSLSGSGPATVSGGVLNLGLNNSNDFTRSGFSGDIQIEGRLGGINVAVGSSRSEWVIGGVRALFHPGFPGGAFRFEGAVSLGNQNMGFTPAAGVLHTIRVRQFGDGDFDVTVIDGNDSSNVFTRSFTDLASVGGDFGPRYLSTGTGIFDDITVRHAAELLATPSVGSQLMVAGGMNEQFGLTDALVLQNVGLSASVLDITGMSISGPDSGLFDVPDFAPTLLNAGSGSEMFDVSFLGAADPGTYTATLTLLTDIGNFDFDLQATVVPEPSTGMLMAVGVVGLARRRRPRRRRES